MTINVNVLESPKFATDFTVKYTINPPNIPPINNIGFTLLILVKDFKSLDITIKKRNINDPTNKLINVATSAVVFFSSSLFINASNDVQMPANIA